MFTGDRSSKVVLLLLVVYLTTAASAAASVACPDGCSCSNSTNHISCVRSGFAEIPRNIDQSVTSLDLSDNALTLIASRSLASLRYLIHLKLDRNEIEKVADGAFGATQSLQTLDLSSNNLTEVKRYTFLGAEMLLHLDLSSNQLSNVEGAFSGMKDLSRLNLGTNHLTSITESTFKGLVSLRYLLLADNRISRIHIDSFQHLEKLMYIVLKGNPLKEQKEFMFYSTFLSYMDLSECGYGHVPRGLPNSIRYLQLRRNNFTMLERLTFTDCVYVSILVLDENQIEDIRNGTFTDMIYLQQLWLNNNRLRRFPNSLPPNLQRLLIESNMLTDIPSDVFPMDSHLETLSLARNSIAMVQPDSLSRLTKAKTIDLSDNRITQLNYWTFAGNLQLKSLQLARNPLQTFHSGCFRDLTSLSKLSLAYISTDNVKIDDNIFQDLEKLITLDLDSSPGVIRRILTSDDLMSSLASVKELSLRNSHLTGLRSDFPDFFTNLLVLQISSNRWNCDYSLTWFKQWIASTTVKLIKIGENTCYNPEVMRNRPIMESDFDEFIQIPYNTKLSSISPADSDKDLMFVDHSKAFDSVNLPEFVSDLTLINSDSLYENGIDWLEFEQSSKTVRTNPTPADYQGGTTKVLTWNELFQSSGRHNQIGSPTPSSGKKKSKLSVQPLSSQVPGKTTSTVRQEEDGRTSITGIKRRYSSNAIIFVAVVVIITVVLVVVIVSLIIFVVVRVSKQNTKRLRKAQEIASADFISAQTTAGCCDTDQYFLPLTLSRSARMTAESSPASSTVPITSARESMSLIPGRDINHEGPLRVYKWTDF